MLDPRQLASIQTAAVTLLNVPVTIQRAPTTPDAIGGNVGAFVQVAAVNAFIAAPTGGFMVALAARITEIQSYTVLLPVGTNVLPGDHIVTPTKTLTVGRVGDIESDLAVLVVFASELR